MAAFIPAVNTARIELLFQTTTADQAISGFWVKRSAPWTATLLQTMMSEFITWFTVGDGAAHSYQSHVVETASLVEVTGRDNTTQNGISIATNAGLPIAGTGPSPAAAPGLTYALTARTGLAGRSFRGRTFLVNPATNSWADYTKGIIANAFADNAVLAFNALVAAVTTADAEAELVVCSRFSGVDINGKPIPRAAAVTTPILAFGYHNLNQDFQRRRSPAHHRHH